MYAQYLIWDHKEQAGELRQFFKRNINEMTLMVAKKKHAPAKNFRITLSLCVCRGIERRPIDCISSIKSRRMS